MKIDWQPIETAPRDKVLLLFSIATDITIGFFSDDMEVAKFGWVTRDGLDLIEPTHWRPTPPPPEVSDVKIDWAASDWAFRIGFNRYGWKVGHFFVAVAAKDDDHQAFEWLEQIEGGDDESFDAAKSLFAGGDYLLTIGSSPVEVMQRLQDMIEVSE